MTNYIVVSTSPSALSPTASSEDIPLPAGTVELVMPAHLYILSAPPHTHLHYVADVMVVSLVPTTDCKRCRREARP